MPASDAHGSDRPGTSIRIGIGFCGRIIPGVLLSSERAIGFHFKTIPAFAPAILDIEHAVSFNFGKDRRYFTAGETCLEFAWRYIVPCMD
jgi:hypothetical protein